MADTPKSEKSEQAPAPAAPVEKVVSWLDQPMNQWVGPLRERFGDRILGVRESAPNEPEIMVAAADAKNVLTALRGLEGGAFEHLADVTSYDDYPRLPRFFVVYELISMTRKQRCSVIAAAEQLSPSELPKEKLGAIQGGADVIAVTEKKAHFAIPTVTDLWKGANWLEREIYDLMGIEFTGHPDMRRILLPQQFQGHPLQKGFVMDYRQQFPESQTDEPVFDPFGNTVIEKAQD